MNWIALTLGFMGSLHCIGMCGPLAIMACSSEGENNKIKSNLFYNLGRIVTYSILGGLFGLLGTFIIITLTQKWIAVTFGILMIITFLLRTDADQLLSKLPILRRYHQSVQKVISLYYQKSNNYSPLIIGMLNGLIPCGLVYLALAGAIASSNWLHASIFMFFFGIGTLPAMAGLMGTFSMMSLKQKLKTKRILPFVTLLFGFFLIYRGLTIEMPMQLNFWEAIKNPIMCH